jgi:peptide/nickel transport system ATP-binding protein
MTSPLVIEDLTVRFDGQPSPALDGFSISLERGEIVGLVGESGSGKSMAAFSILRLEPPGARLTARRLEVDGTDMLTASATERRAVRGRRAGLIFQEPMTALSPTRRVGAQMADVLAHAGGLKGADARARAIALLDQVQVQEPASVLDKYPFELSGGMRQRVLIAMAFAGNPALVIADEITTAIDASARAKVLDLLAERAEVIKAAVLVISHDLGVIRHACSRVLVMLEGKVVEQGPTAQVMDNPAHPYTRMLLASLPERSEPGTRLPVREEKSA